MSKTFCEANEKMTEGDAVVTAGEVVGSEKQGGNARAYASCSGVGPHVSDTVRRSWVVYPTEIIVRCPDECDSTIRG